MQTSRFPPPLVGWDPQVYQEPTGSNPPPESLIIPIFQRRRNFFFFFFGDSSNDMSSNEEKKKKQRLPYFSPYRERLEGNFRDDYNNPVGSIQQQHRTTEKRGEKKELPFDSNK